MFCLLLGESIVDDDYPGCYGQCIKIGERHRNGSRAAIEVGDGDGVGACREAGLVFGGGVEAGAAYRRPGEGVGVGHRIAGLIGRLSAGNGQIDGTVTIDRRVGAGRAGGVDFGDAEYQQRRLVDGGGIGKGTAVVVGDGDSVATGGEAGRA